MVHRVWKKNSDGKVNAALMQTINTGDHVDLNGIMMIVRSLIAAKEQEFLDDV